MLDFINILLLFISFIFLSINILLLKKYINEVIIYKERIENLEKLYGSLFKRIVGNNMEENNGR